LNKIFVILVAVVLFSCDFLEKSNPPTAVARVNDNYLYVQDIREHFGNNFGEDSVLVVHNFINQWATQQLLIDKAKVNLPLSTQEEFDRLVDQYRIDIYTSAYKSNIVSKQLDSAISKAELITYYERNKHNFKLNEDLFKLRYVFVESDFSDSEKIKKQLIDFTTEDKVQLTEMSLKFKSFNLNDSIWIKKDNLLKTLPVLNDYQTELLKKGYFGNLQDSIGLYLVKIKDHLSRNETAPLSYVEPTIRQIILNKRKQELMKRLDKDITTDAIKNKTFEMFNDE